MIEDLTARIEARPKNFGPMRDASAHGKITGPCGDTVEVWLRIDGGRIRKASFMSDGCGHSVHCALLAANTIHKTIGNYRTKPVKPPLSQRLKSWLGGKKSTKSP
ncbi:MAG: iron-sulfur cluster assembly scaffold protein [Verrucomicrobia bacterium]|nr:iron-sulfur cluster assembly scaffold protein [Verrucomicrobiota bacterium]